MVYSPKKKKRERENGKDGKREKKSNKTLWHKQLRKNIVEIWVYHISHLKLEGKFSRLIFHPF